jgi:hypothetical protein
MWGIAKIAGALLALIVWTAGTLASDDPRAPSRCDSYSLIASYLSDAFGEVRTAYGLSDTGAIAETFVSPRGSWTIVLRLPGGRGCVLLWGTAWQHILHPDGRPT